MKEIPLTRGYVAIVDDEDYELVMKYGKWSAGVHPCGVYAVRGVSRQYPHGLLLHRVIMNAKPGQDVDHINHNGLDNRKVNLRVCSRSENIQHSSRHKDSTSPYKGVYREKQCKSSYGAHIRVNQKRVWLGSFETPEAAARAYDAAARQYFGEFARLNFPEG